MNENVTAIESNEPAGESAYRLRFPIDWNSYEPGQFVMVEIPGREVFLRRPFGIVRLEGGCAEILYKVVGPGTRALSMVPVGAELRVMGPCGKGFRLPEETSGTAVRVAGGYGIAPLYGLCERLVAMGRGAVVYYGAKSKSEFLCLGELKEIGVAVSLSTEDGSEGARGLITERLGDDIGAIDRPALYACGPEGLMRAVVKLAAEKGVPAQVSMEAYMACGIGVCMGCVCKDKDGNFVRACREGPVFDAKDLEWT